MARPRSEDKRNAILCAATQVIAEQGESAPTARIAKLAGVAEGTLFTYFSNKDELLNALYLVLKGELRALMVSHFNGKATLREQSWHVWQTFVGWGVANPAKRKVMAQLGMSERLTEQTRATGRESYVEFSTMLVALTAQGVLRERPPEFVASVMMALADTTMEYMTRYPDEAQPYCKSGFDAFWNAVAA